ncbi:hypothetical protein Tco_0743540 [Tanacetum coccineum]
MPIAPAVIVMSLSKTPISLYCDILPVLQNCNRPSGHSGPGCLASQQQQNYPTFQLQDGAVDGAALYLSMSALLRGGQIRGCKKGWWWWVAQCMYTGTCIPPISWDQVLSGERGTAHCKLSGAFLVRIIRLGSLHDRGLRWIEVYVTADSVY